MYTVPHNCQGYVLFYIFVFVFLFFQFFYELVFAVFRFLCSFFPLLVSLLGYSMFHQSCKLCLVSLITSLCYLSTVFCSVHCPISSYDKMIILWISLVVLFPRLQTRVLSVLFVCLIKETTAFKSSMLFNLVST